MCCATVPRHDLPPTAGVKRKHGDALVTDQDALYGPVSCDIKVWDVASAAVNAVPGLNAVMIYSPRCAACGDFLSIRFHTKEYALKFVHLFQYTEGQGDKIAFFPERSPNLPAQGVASGLRPMLRLPVAAWNVNGYLALKITKQSFTSLILSHAVTFFLETFLCPTQEQALVLPPGYHIVTRSRPDPCTPRLPGEWQPLSVTLLHTLSVITSPIQICWFSILVLSFLSVRICNLLAQSGRGGLLLIPHTAWRRLWPFARQMVISHAPACGPQCSHEGPPNWSLPVAALFVRSPS